MQRLLLIIWLACCSGPVFAQDAASPIQLVLQEHAELIAKSSRKTISPAIDALTGSGLPEAQAVLEMWRAKEMWRSKDTGLFVHAEEVGDGTIRIFDFAGGAEIGVFSSKKFKQIKPNSGVRGLIAGALVRFQLADPDPAARSAALDAIERDPKASHLDALRAIQAGVSGDPRVEAQAARLERLLTIRFGANDNERIGAIRHFAGDLGVDVRAALNPLVETSLDVSEERPTGEAVAAIVDPGSDRLGVEDAYALLVSKGFAAPLRTKAEQRESLIANISAGKVAGIDVASLATNEARELAYQELVSRGLTEPGASSDDVETALSHFVFFEHYTGAPAAVAIAAADALADIEASVALNQAMDLALDAVSLASIYFLAAIGLAITFGVMGVINMAHGEFIMMGAYTGYVVQLIVPDYTLSILVALPLAFAVTFGAGVAMERLVIRWLYRRPLETLLATFGISIALQQLAKNIFGTQARPLTAPSWLDGSLVFNDIVSISYIRIAIFVMALVFLALFLIVMNRTRLGLEVRAVTQNPRMAASMGINPDRINMLTFGFGSGIAGTAGVAIGLYSKVTSEMGADYIVQSFMTTVVGGVGSIWGTLLGAALVGTLQKGIEWLNPSNTLAAQTYMILFIILFIQFRPRGIVALKGRAAEA